MAEPLDKARFIRAEAKARAQCLADGCRAGLCVDRQECAALLYDTPGFYDRVMEAYNAQEELAGALQGEPEKPAQAG